MIYQDKLILIGIISSPHGIKGDCIVKSFTGTDIDKLLILNNKGEDLKFTVIRKNSKGDFICRFNDIKTRTEIEKLKGYKLFCLKSTFPKLDEDEFYAEDLKGLNVVNTNLESIGIVLGTYNFGAGDIVEIKFNQEKIALFPFTKEFFPEITNDYIIFKNPNN